MQIVGYINTNCNQFTTSSFPHPQMGFVNYGTQFSDIQKFTRVARNGIKTATCEYQNFHTSRCACVPVLRPVFGSRPPHFSYSNSIWYHRFPISYMEQGDCILLYFTLPRTTRFFLLTSFLRNFLLKSRLRCGSLPSF